MAGSRFDGASHLLSACVRDPKEVVIGGLASLDLGEQDFWFDSKRVILLGMLLRMPGDDRVTALIDLASQGPPEAQKHYFEALGKLVAASSSSVPDYRYGYHGLTLEFPSFDEIMPEPAGAAARKQAITYLCSRNPKKLSIAAAEELISRYRSEKWPGTLPALRRMLDHPSLKIAEAAAEGLKEAGENIVVPAKLGPVRYRILVDGQPYASKRMDWRVCWDNMSTGSEITTDADGVASIPRDSFVDQTVQPIRRVALHGKDARTLSDPWFAIVRPPPPASDEIIPVKVETKPLEVFLSLPRPLSEMKKPMLVRLSDDLSPEQAHVGFGGNAMFTLPAGEGFSFKALAPGTYRLEVRIPGAVTWAGDLKAGQAKQVKVSLKRGADIRFRVKPPAGWPSGGFFPALLQDGKEIFFEREYLGEDRRLCGLPEGSYVLHVPSSGEWERAAPDTGAVRAEFDAVDIPFEVTADSPIEIDLGEIEIPAKL